MTPLRCANSASSARSFVQIARRGYSTTTVHSAAPLDFLVPRRAITSRLRAVDASARPSNQTIRSTKPTLLRHSIQCPQKRPFSASAIRSGTTCILNPQKDEDGNDMMLEITPRAAKRLSEIMKKDSNPNLALRIQVESGGCHGFQYLMSLITIPAEGSREWSSVVNEDDSIFQYSPDDAALESEPQGSARIILDEPSLDLLKGSKVDFTMELIGSQFKIVDNPYATSSCGCGTSFDIKM
ncbi:Iron-sulfur cluster assembly 2, mitochondrial [Tolypocladium capitatum]|uniref:Iron-sulfur cluster assembly 2, mitochondrial n=1 Tax=Tolypocladium capitatum TaxID=45235 RepID=A0A2K3PXF7_9HYPO|nr:Iron-sulfur cluster assembly 2, mitochondrial [Tolypocladium capitatum]